MENKYSVLMSVYKREVPDNLRQSINSMFSQTVLPSEFVLVEDGPLTTELYQVIDDYKRKYQDIFQVVNLSRNIGLANALNEGIKHCKHEIIARMDSDDISKPNRIEIQLKAMEAWGADIVGGTVEEFDGTIDNVFSIRELPEMHEDILKFAKKRNPFNHPTVIFKKSAVENAGMYEDFPYFEDYNLWATMLNNGAKGYNVPETVLYMRAGKDMFGRRGGFAYAKHLWKFKKHLKNMGFLNMGQFIVSAGVHVIVSIMPNSLRRLFYIKLLRREA
ncbi:MAG: glycosyltransferase [Eubacterium sp.]